VLAVGLALLVKLLLDPLIDEESPFLLFFGAVIIGTWFWGAGTRFARDGPGTLTAGYFFLSPTYPLLVGDFGQVLRLALFVLEGRSSACWWLLCAPRGGSPRRGPAVPEGSGGSAP
jgi:K+-sensing histidine kinase KdpD